MYASSRRSHWRLFASTVTLLVCAAAIFVTVTQAKAVRASASGLSIRQLSSDPYTNFATQHQTQVEPGSFASGSTLVTAFQTGRGYTAGSSNIGWATSTDKGKTWKNGFLTGITVNAGGPYRRASDSVVAYDAAHKVWLITSLGVPFSGGYDVLVNRSTDGGLTWTSASPIATSGPTDSLDKDWITCDSTASSPFYGHCYAQWDNAFHQGVVQMSTSSDGGQTWSAPASPPNQTFAGIGGQPVVQPSGKVIVPVYGADLKTGAASVYAFSSTDGGKSWQAPVVVSAVAGHNATSSYRGGILPSASVDGSGKVYVVWSDCSFEDSCTADDIVLSTSSDGTTWSALQRIPLDAIGSGVDHFTAAITTDPATEGAQAHLALTFYEYLNTACFTFNCQLVVGFASSTNGGTSWSGNTLIGKPMQLAWLADTDSGFMTGDYIAISLLGDDAFPFFAEATAPSGGHLNEAIYTTKDADLKVTGGTKSSAGEHPVVKASPVAHPTAPSLPASN